MLTLLPSGEVHLMICELDDDLSSTGFTGIDEVWISPADAHFPR